MGGKEDKERQLASYATQLEEAKTAAPNWRDLVCPEDQGAAQEAGGQRSLHAYPHLAGSITHFAAVRASCPACTVGRLVGAFTYLFLFA